MILILGGTSFVGQHVARHLLDAGETVAVSSHRRAAPPGALAAAIAAETVRTVSLDVTDRSAMIDTMVRLKPRIVIDLTGHPPKALSPASDVTFRTNALLNILESARMVEIGRVVLMSSMDVYWGLDRAQAPFGEDDRVPLIENDDHLIVQSWAKKTLEVIGNLYRQRYSMDILFVSGSGIYGPGYSTYMNMPSRLIRTAAMGEPAPTAARDGEYAESGYDQLYVDDMARGIAMLATASTLAHAVYNIGSGRAPTYAEFAAALPMAPLKLPPRPADASPGLMDGRFMRIDRIRDELGFTPRYSVAAAMADYLAWVRMHGL